MGENSKIEWTDHTFNPWRGCTKVAEGCKFCYAETQSKRFPAGTLGIWGPNGSRVVAAESTWREPVKWNKAAEQAGERPRVFCASMADVFEDWDGPMKRGSLGQILVKPYLASEWGAENWIEDWEERLDEDPQGWQRLTMSDVRRRLFALIDATPHLDWLLVTKRPENILRMWVDPVCKFCDSEPCNREDECSSYAAICSRPNHRHRKNVWLLASASTQADYDRNAHLLYHHGKDLAPVLGMSLEPLIEPIKLWHEYDGEKVRNWQGCFQWIIAGGESGNGARPCNVEWIRSLKDQCQAAGVPCFVKQLGARIAHDSLPEKSWEFLGESKAGPDIYRAADKKGGDWDEWPADLRVREFPEVAR